MLVRYENYRFKIIPKIKIKTSKRKKNNELLIFFLAYFPQKETSIGTGKGCGAFSFRMLLTEINRKIAYFCIIFLSLFL